jgi:hypothetical protein
MNIPLTLLKGIMGMKFGWVILLVVGLLIGGSLIKNIISGSFSIGKFFSGFNFFAGGVQGKLIYFAVLAILGYGLLHQLTKATTEYNTDYRNNIHHNDDVIVDQRVGESGCLVNLGWGLIRFGCNQEAIKVTKEDKVADQTTKNKIPKTNIIPRGKK